MGNSLSMEIFKYKYMGLGSKMKVMIRNIQPYKFHIIDDITWVIKEAATKGLQTEHIGMGRQVKFQE